MSELAILPVARASAASQNWRIAGAFAVKEWTEMWRDSRLLWLFGLTLLLMAGALAFGATQRQRLDHERAAAGAADRKIWTSQGAKDPHAAAGFVRFCVAGFSALPGVMERPPPVSGFPSIPAPPDQGRRHRPISLSNKTCHIASDDLFHPPTDPERCSTIPTLRLSNRLWGSPVLRFF